MIDARSLAPGTTLEADLCIVGAGAAGITLARELIPTGATVLLVESGGLVHEDPTQELYDGPVTGTVVDQESNYLLTTRLRYLGGTTNHWNGWCRPIDPIVFGPRPWVEGASGWPIARSVLDPYYQRAAALVQVVPFGGELTRPGPDLFEGEAAPLQTAFFHVSHPIRFAGYRPELEAAPGVRLLLHANAVAIDLEPGGRRVERIELACLGGPRLRARARHFVIATGAIENARLLLASRSVQAEGVGNDRGQVGRYYMDHPHAAEAGYAVLPHRSLAMGLYRGYTDRRHGYQRVQGVLVPSDAVQQELGLRHGLVWLVPLPETHAPHLGTAVGHLAEHMDGVVDLPGEPPQKTFYCRIAVSGEPAPNPASRVVLAEERDALGSPRARLEWRLLPGDAASMRRLVELFARELGASRLGRAAVGLSAGEPWRGITWSAHHMGTTRMSAGPRDGVVDGDCRVHGIDNLYLAGSSVFPSVGCSNPTFTLVALAIRLGDHLKARLGA